MGLQSALPQIVPNAPKFFGTHLEANISSKLFGKAPGSIEQQHGEHVCKPGRSKLIARLLDQRGVSQHKTFPQPTVALSKMIIELAVKAMIQKVKAKVARVSRRDHEVSRMRVTVDEAVDEDHMCKCIDDSLCDLLRDDILAVHGFNIVDAEAMDVVHDEQFVGRVLVVDVGHKDARVIAEEVGGTTGGLCLHLKVEFITEVDAELVDDPMHVEEREEPGQQPREHRNGGEIARDEGFKSGILYFDCNILL